MSVTASDYYFIKVPAAIQDLKLSASEGWVLVMLLSHGAKPGSEVYPSDERLMSMTLLDKKTIHASIEALVKKNIIQVKREKFSDKKVYVINHPDEWGKINHFDSWINEKNTADLTDALSKKLSQVKLTPDEFGVFVALLLRTPASFLHGEFICSDEWLRETTDLPDSTIANVLTSLKEKKLIYYSKALSVLENKRLYRVMPINKWGDKTNK